MKVTKDTVITSIFFTIFILMLFWVCQGCGKHPCGNTASPEFYDYKFKPTYTTEAGYKVDTSGQDIDISTIDARVAATVECMNNVDFDRVEGAYCYETVKYPAICIKDCLKVKITKKWDWSYDGKYQLLRKDAPIEGCIQKGFEEDPDCPCRWRAGIQDPGIVVVPPDMALFEGTLVQWAAGCINPWGDKQLRECTRNIHVGEE